jgi:hypothetical protein
MKKIILWLDDMRDPSNNFHWRWIPEITQGTHEVIWVKDYKSFKNYILENKMPDIICFDHDLAEEHIEDFREQRDYHNEGAMIHPRYQNFNYGTGYDAAKWLGSFCYENMISLPKWRIQSANIVGAENIKNVLLSYERLIQ